MEMSENFIGAAINEKETYFSVWAPFANHVQLVLPDLGRKHSLHPGDRGYFSLTLPSLDAETRYGYSLDGGPVRPDPASRYQPEGVHRPSAIVPHSFAWTDQNWTPPSLNESVFYELHVGTFSEAGTFDAILPHLVYLKELGITSLQLMPIAQFPGNRNWGYDGVQLFAPHSAYGGPEGLQRLVNACHKQELAVFLDVVYNHLGPEGNYLGEFGPYFTDQYTSPWGSSINLDGAHSDEVRSFFIQNAIYWLDTFHIDGLRLDATHALFDFSARPFLRELSEEVHNWANQSGRQITLVAENDQSDRRLTLPVTAHGLGMDAQWLDDLHHTLHVALTGENKGYYVDYQDAALLTKVLDEGFAYSGQYSPARKRKHGTLVRDLSTERFIVSTQTHDQIGNRMQGERLSRLTSFEGLKLAAGLLACSPYTPMLFMGQEYGELAPFLYFVSHSDPQLVEAVRQGRAAEFADFAWKGTPPDPQAEATFHSCKLDHSLRESGFHQVLHAFYKALFHIRKTTNALTHPERSSVSISSSTSPLAICMERRHEHTTLRVVMNVDIHQESTLEFDPHSTYWEKILDSSAPRWCIEPGTPNTLPDAIPPGPPVNLSVTALSFAIYKSTISE